MAKAELMWFYWSVPNQVGPFSRNQLTSLHEKGVISGKTFVIEEHSSEWVPLERILKQRHGESLQSIQNKYERLGKASSAMSRSQFWLGALGLYLAGIAVVLSKVWRQFGGQIPIENVWQALALSLLPLIWGILPIALTFVWLAIKGFNLSAAKTGLLCLATIYLVLIFFQWQSPRPI